MVTPLHQGCPTHTFKHACAGKAQHSSNTSETPSTPHNCTQMPSLSHQPTSHTSRRLRPTSTIANQPTSNTLPHPRSLNIITSSTKPPPPLPSTFSFLFLFFMMFLLHADSRSQPHPPPFPLDRLVLVLTHYVLITQAHSTSWLALPNFISVPKPGTNSVDSQFVPVLLET